VFRHFATRDDLLAAAIRAGIPAFEESLPSYPGEGDWRVWLTQLCRALHAANTAYGPMLWGLMTGRDLGPQLSAVAEELAEQRRKHQQAIADILWEAGGHGGPTPDEFRATVLAHLSPFFTMAVHDEAGDQALAAHLAEIAILAMIDK
jgi:AcrR family transcriptional regulator